MSSSSNSVEKASYDAQSTRKPPVLNLKLTKLSPTSTKVTPYVYNYIKNLLLNNSDYDVIKNTLVIAKSRNDKIIALANLFYICVRQNKITIIILLFRELTDQEKLFVVNSYDRLYTPIMHAAYDGSYDAVKLLITYNADINITNINDEDIRSAAIEGYKNAIAKLISSEQESRIIFVKPKYDKIIQLIDDIRAGNINDDLQLEEYNYQNKFEYKLLNIKNDIFSQINNIIVPYIEDCNTSNMCKLFVEINNLIKDNIINKEDVKIFFDKYKSELESEYPEEYAILQFN